MKIFIGILRVGLLILSCWIQWGLGLKDVTFKVPATVERGHDAILRCLFDLDGDTLYSVLLYRGTRQFYRYTPSDRPPLKQFPVKGLHVREQDSNSTQVVLEKVQRDISGSFSCEVTAEQPSFYTEMQTAHLQVVDLPQRDPYITGLKHRYRLGEILKAHCTSEGSNPAANLTWYLNGKPADHKFVHRHKPVDIGDDLFMVQSTLRLLVSKHHLEEGRLKIRCIASLYDIYHRSCEKSVGREILTTTSTTMVPYKSWELTQSAKRPPDTTGVFLSPLGETTNASPKKSCPTFISQIFLIILINFVLFKR